MELSKKEKKIIIWYYFLTSKKLNKIKLSYKII